MCQLVTLVEDHRHCSWQKGCLPAASLPTSLPRLLRNSWLFILQPPPACKPSAPGAGRLLTAPSSSGRRRGAKKLHGDCAHRYEPELERD